MNKNLSKISILLLAGVVAWSCGQKEGSSSAVNTLSEQEKNEGWRLLFDGTSMEHFRGFRQSDAPAQWKVEDGTITLTAKGGGDIITREQYRDFDFSIDWKISEGGNSGIFYHVSEDSTYDNTYNSGPEMQILDDERHPDAQRGENGNRQAGSLYDLLPLTTPAVKPAGEWNTARLVVKDNKVEHWLNEKKVVEYELGSPAWNAMVESSKFATMEGFGAEGQGYIGLQDHGDRVWFRNIKIRPL